MNCWGHGPTTGCSSGVCRDCKTVMGYGDGVVICESCSLAKGVCQTCERIPAWDPTGPLKYIDYMMRYDDQNSERYKTCAEIKSNILNGKIVNNYEVVSKLRSAGAI